MATLTSKKLTLSVDSLKRLKTTPTSRFGLKKREVAIDRNAKSFRAFKGKFPPRDKFGKYPHDKKKFTKKPKLTPEQKAAQQAAKRAERLAKKRAKRAEEIFNIKFRYETVNGLKVKFPRLHFQKESMDILRKILAKEPDTLSPRQKKLVYIYENISKTLAMRVKWWDSVRLDIVIVYSNIAGAEAALKMFDVKRRRFYIDLKKRIIKIASIDKESIQEVKNNEAFMNILYGIVKARSRVTFFPFFECKGAHFNYQRIRNNVRSGKMNYFKGEKMIHNMIKATLIRRAEKREARRLKEEEEQKLNPKPKTRYHKPRLKYNGAKRRLV
jgi:hypothetical protein